MVTSAIIFVVPTDTVYMLGAADAWLPASKLATLALSGVIKAKPKAMPAVALAVLIANCQLLRTLRC